MRVAESLDRLKMGQDLEPGQMRAFMEELMTGRLEEGQVMSFLLALKEKGESVQEIIEAAKVMREHLTPVSCQAKELLDTCGTGGDESSTLNVSTLAALVASSAGVSVAKHGNRAISSHSGSADFLSVLGLPIEMTPEDVARGIETVGFGFMFAPSFHPAMKHVAPVRKKLKTRTIFNCLGPLTNPAGANHQLLGVYDEKLVEPLAKALGALGSKHVLVVHGQDGLDEVTLTAQTTVGEWESGAFQKFIFTPEDLGFKRASLDELKCESPEESLREAQEVIKGKPGPKTDFVVLNSGFALKASDRVKTLEEGVSLARTLLEKGEVLRKIDEIKAFYTA